MTCIYVRFNNLKRTGQLRNVWVEFGFGAVCMGKVFEIWGLILISWKKTFFSSFVKETERCCCCGWWYQLSFNWGPIPKIEVSRLWATIIIDPAEWFQRIILSTVVNTQDNCNISESASQLTSGYWHVAPLIAAHCAKPPDAGRAEEWGDLQRPPCLLR